MALEATTDVRHGKSQPNEEVAAPPTPAAFRGSQESLIHTLFALSLFLGLVHLNIFIVITSFAFFPLHKALGVMVLLLILIVIPVDERSKWGRKLARYICKHVSGYFPMKLYVEDITAFDPNEAYVFGYAPHSIWSIGVVALADLTGLMPVPNIKLLASSTFFCTPFMRHIWSWMGYSPATRKNFTSLLESGYSCNIIPGGIQEALHMEHGVEVVFLRSRRGFVRIAIETGKPLVPVFCYGECEVYRWWKPNWKLYREFSRAIRFAPIVFWGVLGSPIPFRRPMHVVVGQPIVINKNSQPTDEEVGKVHTQFIEALQDLFERHKVEAGYADLQLKII